MKKKKNIVIDFITNNGIDKFLKDSEPTSSAFEKFVKENGDCISYSYFIKIFNQYSFAISVLPDKLNTKNLSEVIDIFPRKHKQGFTSNEINALLKKYGIDKVKFAKEMGINTCMVIDGETVSHDNDIEKSIRCLLEGRTKNVFEWD